MNSMVHHPLEKTCYPQKPPMDDPLIAIRMEVARVLSLYSPTYIVPSITPSNPSIIQNLFQNWCSFSLGLVLPSIRIPTKHMYLAVHYLSNKYLPVDICMSNISPVTAGFVKTVAHTPSKATCHYPNDFLTQAYQPIINA